MTAKIYERKPMRVTAERFQVDVLPWPNGVTERDLYDPQDCSWRYSVTTTSGGKTFRATISDGDWIVTHKNGRREILYHDTFKTLFDEVSGDCLKEIT